MNEVHLAACHYICPRFDYITKEKKVFEHINKTHMFLTENSNKGPCILDIHMFSTFV